MTINSNNRVLDEVLSKYTSTILLLNKKFTTMFTYSIDFLFNYVQLYLNLYPKTIKHNQVKNSLNK